MITIVSGIPRSGTSLMMQMISAGGMPVLTDNLRSADANNPRGYYELESVKALARNPDILGNLAGMDLPGLVRIGFAAETQDLLDNARDKLKKKKLDMIVANDAVASIGAESSALTFILKDGTIEQLPPLPKEESARLIVDRLAAMLDQKA